MEERRLGTPASVLLSILRSERGDARKAEYTFSVVGSGQDFQSAIVPVDSLVIDQALVAEVVETLIRPLPTNPTNLARLGKILYQSFVSRMVREYVVQLLDGTPPAVMLVTNDGNIPWELAHDGTDHWCARFALGRIHASSVFGVADGPRRERRRKRPRIGLLVNPTGDLPGASHEGHAIREQLADCFDVDLVEGEAVSRLCVAEMLSSGEYDIIHYAGHASFEGGHASLVLGDGESVDEGEVANHSLTAAPLVFANACSTGRGEYVGDRILGLAAAFVRAGAMAYVGALWAVNDEVAASFAAAFYAALLKGEALGAAMVHARKTVRTDWPHSHDWAAFVLHGYPEKTPFSDAYSLRLTMSDKPGTLARVLTELANVGVNILGGRSITLQPGETAGYAGRIELPSGMSAEDVQRDLRARCGEQIIGLEMGD